MALLLEMIVKFTPKHTACLFVCFSAINPCGYLSLALYWLKIARGKARMASILAGVRLIFLLSTLVAASVPFLLKFKGLLQHLCFIWALSTLWMSTVLFVSLHWLYSNFTLVRLRDSSNSYKLSKAPYHHYHPLCDSFRLKLVLFWSSIL